MDVAVGRAGERVARPVSLQRRFARVLGAVFALVFAVVALVNLDELRDHRQEMAHDRAQFAATLLEGVGGFCSEAIPPSRGDGSPVHPPSDPATPIVAEIAARLGPSLSVRAVCDRPWANGRLPDPLERQALAHFRADPLATEWQRVIDTPAGAELLLATPIRVEPRCLHCHQGPARARSVGLRPGELRGALVVRLPVAAGPQGGWLGPMATRQLAVLLGGLAAMFLTTYLFLRHALFARLARLHRALLALREGDYAVRVARTGDDEIGELGANFNAMAAAVEERERRLRDSEQGHATVQRIARLGHWEWAIADDRLTWSDEVFRIFGMEPGAAEADLELFLSRLHTDDRATVERAIDGALHDERPFELKHRIVLDDGRVRHVRAQGEVSRDASGRPLRMLGTIHDITDRHEAELALRRSEERVRLLLESSGEGIFGVDLAGLCTFCNPAALRMLGYADQDELLGREMHRLTHHADVTGNPLPAHVCGLRIALTTGHPCHRSDELFRRRDGTAFPVEYRAHPIYQEGRTTGAVCTFSDITRRKAREDRLRTLAQAVENSPASVVITDADGRIEFINRKLEALTGYTLEEIRGRTSRVFHSGKTPPETYQELWATLTRRQEWHGTFINRKKSGEEFIEEAWISPIVDQYGRITHYVGVKEDVTERRAMQRRIWQQANFDNLTGLANRSLFGDRLEQALRRAQRERGALALMFVDLDGFKGVNDRLGHHAGDELLVAVARRLTDCVRGSDTVARMGGDEFTLLLPEVRDAQTAARVALKLRRCLAEPFALQSGEVSISGSIGVALYPQQGATASELLRAADRAMYQVKQEGRDGFGLDAAGR